MTCLFRVLYDHYGSDLELVLSLLKYLHDTDRDTGEFPLPSRGLASDMQCTRAEARGRIKRLMDLNVIVQLREVPGHATQYGLSTELADLLQSASQSGRHEGGPQGENRSSSSAEQAASSRGGRIAATREYYNLTILGTCSRGGTGTPHPKIASRSAVFRPPFFASELRALHTCLPGVPWSKFAAGLRADGVPTKNIQAALQLALHEALLGTRRVRSWGRWLRVVVKAPESVDEASQRTIHSWLAALEPLRARLAALGAPADVEDAPGVRDALTALLEASGEDGARRGGDTASSDTASSDVARRVGGVGVAHETADVGVARRVVALYSTWEQVLKLYGGNSTLTLLDAGAPVPMPPSPVSLEYQLWAAYGTAALVQAKTAEMEELRDCGVEVVFPSVKEGSHGC